MAHLRRGHLTSLIIAEDVMAAIPTKWDTDIGMGRRRAVSKGRHTLHDLHGESLWPNRLQLLFPYPWTLPFVGQVRGGGWFKGIVYGTVWEGRGIGGRVRRR